MMKRKRILALVLVSALVFLLCGCSLLEKMRSEQVFYQGENILRNGQVYMPLPTCDTLFPDVDGSKYLYLTDADVPVLLSTAFAKELLTPSKDDVFLLGNRKDVVYCREDMYGEIAKRIQDGFTPEMVCYSYEVYDEENYDVIEKFYTLTKEQEEVIKLITSTVEPQTMGDGWWLDSQWYIFLEECSKDRLFRKSSLEIAFTGKTYYLLLYVEDKTLAFAVPSGCVETFQEITKAYVETQETYWGEGDDYI